VSAIFKRYFFRLFVCAYGHTITGQLTKSTQVHLPVKQLCAFCW